MKGFNLYYMHKYLVLAFTFSLLANLLWEGVKAMLFYILIQCLYPLKLILLSLLLPPSSPNINISGINLNLYTSSSSTFTMYVMSSNDHSF